MRRSFLNFVGRERERGRKKLKIVVKSISLPLGSYHRCRLALFSNRKRSLSWTFLFKEVKCLGWWARWKREVVELVDRMEEREPQGNYECLRLFCFEF